jgi:hypothetical protein
MFVSVLILLGIVLKEKLIKENEYSADVNMSLSRNNADMFYLFADLPVLPPIISDNVCHYVCI